MWIATEHGFYSAVENRKDKKTVIVRTRVREDADRLAAWVGKNATVVDSPSAVAAKYPSAIGAMTPIKPTDNDARPTRLSSSMSVSMPTCARSTMTPISARKNTMSPVRLFSGGTFSPCDRYCNSCNKSEQYCRFFAPFSGYSSCHKGLEY